MKLKSFLQGFGIIAILLTLLPLIALDYWWIRVFDFPHAQLTGLTFIALAVYFIRFDVKYYKDYIFVGILLACFIYQMVKIYEYTPLASYEVHDSTITESSNTLKIYSANVLQKNKEYQLVLDQISKKDPDIILLMETDQSWKNAVHQSLAKNYRYQMLEPLDNTYGMLFYSRLPISNQKIRHLVDKEIPSMEAVVSLPSGEQFQLYTIHPTPPMPQHNPMSSDRDTEMMKTALTVNDRKMPVIVLGDFNDVTWSRTTSLFRKVSRLLDPRIGRGFHNTFNAKNILMRWPLDHIFTSEEFRVKSFDHTDGINSDHFPLYTELTLEPNKAKDQLPTKPTESELKSARDQMDKQNLLNIDMPNM
ncbi:endonuclease/exonuclease/phosphatase family protein [Dokdonia sp. Hel_I_53]|uniref:endonuclease/exonuclease/phosphatase family protein n=1 Tax=Dokdonia sp. Hel_I_53 TaxID=1566287 RepID=UPI00119C56A7|nr:endonuclease/exonuclease/phosphatase family protein [Dokdonia sp. Hel_I_53]TVZ50989.1 endonuclease/exonuclease/phosphatase (EEP) superfamily protein YafD [Dokdonia sp. Hel_I_53]